MAVSLRTSAWLLAMVVGGLALACQGKPEQPEAGASPPDQAAAEPAPDLEGTLTVLDWAGYEDPSMFSSFVKKYPKAKVQVAFGESDPDIYAKVKAGADACVFHPYSGWLPFYVTDGLVRPIDTARLTNWSAVPERFKAQGQVNGQQYFVPFDWGYTSILYRTDKVPGGIDSWSALFDRKFKGHISMWDDGPGAVTISTYIKGWDETNLTDAQLEEIKKDWIAQKKLNLFYWTAEPELTQAMAAGDVWVAYAWQGAYNTLLGQGVPVAYAQPKEERNSWVGFYGISTKCQNPDLALAFLDEKLTEEVATNLITSFAYGHVNPNAVKNVTDQNIVKALSLDDPSVLERTRFTPNISEKDRERFGQLWAEVKAAP